MCVLGWFVEVGPSRDLLLHTVAYSATHTLTETVPDCHSTWILMEHTRPYSHHLSWWFEKNSNYYCTKNMKACMCVICMCVYFCSLVLCYHLLRKHSNIPSDNNLPDLFADIKSLWTVIYFCMLHITSPIRTKFKITYVNIKLIQY